MNTPTTLNPPSRPTPKDPARSKTLEFSRRRLILARVPPFLLMPVIFLLGLGAGAAAILMVQYAHGVVATVNGVPIRDGAFYHRLEVAAGPQVLQQMVNEEMQIQFAQKEGVLPTAADVEAKLDVARRQPNFAQTLASSRQTEDDLRHSLLANMAQAAVMTKGVTVTDADVQAFYKKNVDKTNVQSRYYTPEATQIAVIVTATPQAANQALADLSAGMPFAQAAAKYSQDPSAAHAGLLPPILRGRSNFGKVPRLEDLLFGMQVGQQRNLVQIGKTWWIIRCVGHRPEITQPFDTVKDEARLGAMLAKGIRAKGTSMQAAFADFQKTSDIKPIWPQYKPAAK